ncbi:MAG TPA: serpin family protein, partial [Polyangiaceae bacterium]|nr:serpin family protein [Polyangiaceae bacterium]
SSACGSNGGQTGDEHNGLEELKGVAQRLTAGGALPNSASTDGWEFGWKFYAEEATPAQNAFFSPYSISVASAMLVAGASGETKSEMQAALAFSSDGDAFHQARNSVSQALEARNRPGTENANAQSLRVSNDLWLARDFRPTSTFLDTLSSYYGASSFLAPFSAQPEKARLAINAKVADDTEQLIPELLPDGSIANDTLFVLTNALYFNAHWAHEFSEATTTQQVFHAQSGATPEVPMMHAQLGVSHFSGPDYTAVALPYERFELELVAIMPSAGSFDSFSQNLTAASIANITNQLVHAELDLSFPKFGIESTVPLKERLQALGMQRAFSDSAEFNGIAPGIYLSGAFHDATLVLDEEGTEAAAATAFVGVGTSEPQGVIPVVFDRPFVFFIRDVETNALLFVGHYTNP